MTRVTSVENYEDSSPDVRASEPATEIAEESVVLAMAEVPSHQQVIVSGNITSNVNGRHAKGKDPVSELGYQNCNLKDMGGQSSNGLSKGYAPLLKTLGGGMKVTDDKPVIKRSYYSSAGHHIHVISNGIETEHFYPWDSETGQYKHCQCASHSLKRNGFLSMNQNGTSASQNFSLNARASSVQATSSFRKPSLISQNFRQTPKECQPAMRSALPHRNPQCSSPPDGPSNNEFTQLQIYKGNNESDVSKERVCGPRAHGGDSLKRNEMEDEAELPYFARRKNFNLPDFQTEYENAKFYIIKSFGEDNVHKSIKYGVWSSTPHGNGKLEAAYHEAKAKSIETGTKCPIFFFFSVNRSGQFVGVAEMIGRVDFTKDLDFWQLDKWSGFFPVKWHILKDIPHSALWHIILKENDNRSVTYTRDTQEIGLCQGIEMLKIFKNYPTKTSLIDDFSFYEKREKLRAAERKNKVEKKRSEDNEPDYDTNLDKDAAGYGRTYSHNRAHEDITSVIRRTRKISLNSRSS